MFDPERDDDPGARRFYTRLLVVLCVSAAACFALWPSVSGFSVGPDGDRGCVAVFDGWHADHGPTAADRAVGAQFFGGRVPTPDETRALAHSAAAYAWLDGPGACVPQSRHRLIMSGIALGSLGALVGGVALERRTRHRARPEVGAGDPVGARA